MARRVLTGALALVMAVGVLTVGEPGTAAPAAAAPPPAVTCPDPLPGPRAVVQLAYMVLLRRCPDATGAAAWESSLRDGIATGTFARRIASTPEARGVVAADAYRMVLARSASASERAFWAGWLRPGANRQRRHDQLLAELAASPEVWNAAGREAPTFVSTIYQRVLGRTPPAGDVAYWVDRLASSGGDRRALARTLLRLTEPLAATVDAAWAEVLGASPTSGQRAADVARLRRDGDRLGLSARLVGSTAFDDRAQARALVVPGRYVALGDSFVVGEGTTPYLDEEESPCGYTTSAYPEVARTSSELVPGDLDVVACTGTSLAGLYPYVDSEEPGQPTVYPGQIDALADGESPSLVTLTIGGEDIGMVSLIQSCLQVQVDRVGQLSPYYDRFECDQQLDTYAHEAIETLRTGTDDPVSPDDGPQCTEPCSLTSVLSDVVAAAPDAQVVVVGYPQIMATKGAGCRGPVLIDGKPTPGLEWYAAHRDVTRGRKVISDLNAALSEAATAAGATYVDVTGAYAGHEACSADPWINGTLLDEESFPQYGSYHPNRRGGVATAAALIAALDN